MRDHEIWRSELISEVRAIADEEELKRLWAGVDATSSSSFAEEVAHVFDDYDIDGFIAAGPLRAKLNAEQYAALARFRDRFASYVDSLAPAPLVSIRYEQVLGDPLWREVISAASGFISLLDQKG